MVRPQLSAPAKARVKAMVELRDCVHHLIDLQLQDGTDGEIQAAQQQLNALYDAFTPNFGLVNDKANRLAFSGRRQLLSPLRPGGAGSGREAGAQGGSFHQAHHPTPTAGHVGGYAQ